MSKHLLSVGLASVLALATIVGVFPMQAQAYWPVPPEGVLFCWPALQWAPSGQEIVLTAGYDYGPGYDLYQLSWSAPGGSPSHGSGAAFETTFWSSYERTEYVTVTDGSQTATCEVRVQPSWTPTPTPWPTTTPNYQLQLSPLNPNVQSGERIIFTAWGGDGSYRWRTTAGNPETGRGTTFTTWFENESSRTVYHEVTVTSDGQSVTTWVGVYPEDDDDEELSCSADRDTAESGQSVRFTAYGAGAYFNWSAPNGDPSYGWGTPFWTRFTNTTSRTKTYTATVSTEYGSADCSVRVKPDDDDSDSGTVDLSHTVRNETRGQEGSSVSAWSGDRLRFTIRVTPRDEDLTDVFVRDYLPWNFDYISGSTYLDGSRRSNGITDEGISLGTFREDRTYVIRFDATVRSTASGWYSNSVDVRADNLSTRTTATTVSVEGSSWTPTPTPWPTPWPTVAPSNRMTVSHTGRNVTRGQTKEHSSVRATGNETLDLIMRVSNPTGGHLTNVHVTEQLPSGVTAIAGTTSVDGQVTSNGISSGGIFIGSIAPYTTKVVKVSVLVDGSAVPERGQVTTSTQVQVRADNVPAQTATLTIYLGTAPVVSGSAAGSVPTGPFDSVMLALATALLVTGAYAAYTRTDLFGRRLAIAQLAGRIGAPLNFSR